MVGFPWISLLSILDDDGGDDDDDEWDANWHVNVFESQFNHKDVDNMDRSKSMSIFVSL